MNRETYRYAEVLIEDCIYQYKLLQELIKENQ